MLAWSEGTDRRTSENQKSWLWRHCRPESYLPDYSDHPRKLVTLNPKLKSTGAGLPASFGWWDAYRKQLGLKDFSRKVRTLWHCSRLRSVALYLWLIVVISVRQSTVAAISGLHCRALVMVSSSIRLTAWLQNSKKRAERSERLMYEQSHRDYLALVICIIVCLSWAVNHYRDNAITYKAQRDKNADWSWRTRQLLTCRCVSVMLLRSMQNTQKELADAKAENDALRDDVAAGRRRLHIKAVCQSVREATTASTAWIMQPPPTGRHRWTGLFHPPERGAVTMQKQLEGTQVY